MTDTDKESGAGRLAHVPEQVTARGPGAIGAGRDASYNANGKGSSVQDNRTFVIVSDARTHEASGAAELTAEQTADALDAYAQQIKAAYGRLDLEVLMPTTEGEHPRVELREVFVPPLLRADPPRVELPVELHRRLVECGELTGPQIEVPTVPGVDRQMWEQARQAYRDRPAVGLFETLVAAESGRVVLLGDPGAGKSTLARYLALALTSSAFGGPLESLSGLLPVMIELRRYADADWRERSFEDFLDHVHRHEGNAPAPALLRSRLGDGQALVVFDGLDELFDPKVRDDVTRRIAGFAARYPDVRIVVTSRLIGYTRHALDAADFRHYMIQSLDDQQIDQFAVHWYQAVCPADKEEAVRLRTRLTDAVKRSRPVRELAGNPLLLTILAIIARRQRLPRDRAGVYQHAVNVLIAHWDEDTKHLDLTQDVRAIADLDDRDRREMLERLARHMQSGEGGIAGNHVLGDDVERVFTTHLRETLQLDTAPAKKVARAMVKQFRERNFILSRYGSQVYGFVHRAFLEYLAAADIVRRYEQRELTDEELLDGIFARRAPDPTWHEVLLLIVGQVGEKAAGRAIDRVLDLEAGEDPSCEAPSAVLALRALAEVRRIGALEEQSARTADAVTRYWERRSVLPRAIRSDIETSLHALGSAWSGSRRIRRWLHASGGDIKSSVVIYRLFQDRGVLEAIATRAWNPVARAHALAELVRRWPADHGTLRFVREVSLQDRNEAVRNRAVEALAMHWRREEGVRELVQNLVTEDEHHAVRARAMTTLASFWAREPGVRELVKERAAQDGHAIVRQSGFITLGGFWHDDPTVRELILEQAVHDADPGARQGALAALLGFWREDPVVRELVVNQVTHGAHGLLRDEALVLLAGFWHGDAEVRRLVREWATGHADGRARATSLVTLAQYWGDDVAVRELVAERAVEDPHQVVRRDALAALGAHWGDDPAVRQLVAERAVADPHQTVRRGALATLAQHWGDDAGVHDMLMTRAIEDAHDGVRQGALDALARLVPEEPTAKALVRELRSRACTDATDATADHLADRLANAPHPKVRTEAARLLAALWSADPRTIPALRSRAGNDPDPEVREAVAVAADMAEAYAPVHVRLW